MTKRPGNLETVRLTLELLRRIPRNRKVTASELHAQVVNEGFKRDLRTVQRQLKLLSEYYDIELDERSMPYGYRWKERAVGLSVPTLNEHESLLLMLAEQHLKNLLPVSVTKAMAGFFEQASRTLDALTGEKKGGAWLSKVRVVSETQPLIAPKVSEEVFTAVSQALYEDRWLDIEYVNSEGKRLSKTIMPLALAQQGVRLYLVCRFEGYIKDLTLVLHRISAAQVSTRGFNRPEDFDLDTYAADGQFGWGEGERIRLTFLINKVLGYVLLESPLSGDQKVRDVGDQYEISATVVDSGLLRRWLQSFGDDVCDIRTERCSDGLPN